ncbi:hypothetical protein HDU77_006708 [Chytriomyces hyalinus]|nr:hypothetical protein HDU77_006708 [Chytriomyces hyalinus]
MGRRKYQHCPISGRICRPRLKLLAALCITWLSYVVVHKWLEGHKTQTQHQQQRDTTNPIEVHLIGQWYWPKSVNRTKELIRVLATNTNNTFIQRIHLVQPVRETPAFINKPTKKHLLRYFERILVYDAYFPMEMFLRKLEWATTSHSGNLLASDAFRYASQRLKHDVVPGSPTKVAILANQDIYFDTSLQLLSTSPHSDLSQYTSYFLSRYEEADAEADSLIGTQCSTDKFVGSHDAFVFVPPLPGPLIERCAFELGSWGIEARLLWEFEQFGITGRNPCKDIKIWHVHRGGLKERGSDAGSDVSRKAMPEVNVDGKSSIAFPDALKTQFKKVVDELWGLQVSAQKS